MFEDITFKIALGMVIIGACALAGRAMARVDRRRAVMLAEIMDGMHMLRVHMLDELMPLQAALEKSQAFVFSETGRQMAGRSAYDTWQELSRRETARGGRLDSLAADECEVLDGFFRILGSSAREEQRQIFDRAIRDIGALESASRTDGLQKNRLYTALGALAGAAAVVGLV